MTTQSEAFQSIAEFVGPKGDRWVLDESLKKMAEELVERYSEDLGHVKLGHVVFVRAIGVSSTTWLGKIKYLGNAPDPLIARYVLATLGSMGMLDLTQLRGLEADLMDIRYVVMINDTAMRAKSGASANAEMLRATLERITLYHELTHIKPAMDGLVPHDTQDFKRVLYRFGVYWSSGIINQTDPVDLAAAEDAASRFAEQLNKGGATFEVVVNHGIPSGVPSGVPSGGSEG